MDDDYRERRFDYIFTTCSSIKPCLVQYRNLTASIKKRNIMATVPRRNGLFYNMDRFLGLKKSTPAENVLLSSRVLVFIGLHDRLLARQ